MRRRPPPLMPVTEWAPGDEFDRRQGGRAVRNEQLIGSFLLGCLFLQLVGTIPIGCCLMTEGKVDKTYFRVDPSDQNSHQRRYLHIFYVLLISASVYTSGAAAVAALRTCDVIELHWVLIAVGVWLLVCAECLTITVAFYLNA